MKRPQDFDVCWSGWWFGTCWNMNFYDFPYLLGMSSSQLTNSIIFQRGWNHQPVIIIIDIITTIIDDYNHYYWWLSHYWCIAVFFWISMFNSSTTRTMNPRSDGFWSGFRSRKPGGCSGSLEIYFQVYWCVLMCIVVYCLFGNGDFVIICDLACDVIPIWEILWNGLKCFNVWICLDDWHIWDRV